LNTSPINTEEAEKKKGGCTMKQLKNKISAEEFDKKFDKGEDVSEYLDTSKAKANKHFHRINIDFPELFIKRIDDEAHK
jgi:hypothetical protein